MWNKIRNAGYLRHEVFQCLLSGDTTNGIIDLEILRSLCETGIPAENSIRSICWKLLLGFLPKDRKLWKIQCEKNRRIYFQIISEMTKEIDFERFEKIRSLKIGKHEINLKKNNKNNLINKNEDLTNKNDNEYYCELKEDIDIVETINVEIKRTKANYSLFGRQITAFSNEEDEKISNSFFVYWNKLMRLIEWNNCTKTISYEKGDSNGQNGRDVKILKNVTEENVEQTEEVFANEEVEIEEEKRCDIRSKNYSTDSSSSSKHIKIEESSKRCLDKMLTDKLTTSTHKDVISRIIFIYIKLNPFMQFIQGMANLLIPIYYLFCTDQLGPDLNYAEPDAFFCFNSLMAEHINNLTPQMDKDKYFGIYANINKIHQRLKYLDTDLFDNLCLKSIQPVDFAFQWITVLLTKEFSLPDLIQIWDSLISDPHRFDRLYTFCAAMIIHLRDDLMNLSFSQTMKLLQNYPPINPSILLDETHRYHNLIKHTAQADLHNHRKRFFKYFLKRKLFEKKLNHK